MDTGTNLHHQKHVKPLGTLSVIFYGSGVYILIVETLRSKVTSGSLERRVTRGGESFLLRFVTKSVSWPIISMYFISTYSTQLFQGFIKI
jgi:hypothetical protein